MAKRNQPTEKDNTAKEAIAELKNNLQRLNKLANNVLAKYPAL